MRQTKKQPLCVPITVNISEKMNSDLMKIAKKQKINFSEAVRITLSVGIGAAK